MHLGHLIVLSTVLWLTSYLANGSYQDEELLETAINALYNGLQFMEDHLFEINLDGALGCKLVYGMQRFFLSLYLYMWKRKGILPIYVYVIYFIQ